VKIEIQGSIQVAISPCPNDSRTFYDLIEKGSKEGIEDSHGNSFGIEVIQKDINSLNQMAVNSEVDLIKLSAAQIPAIVQDYWIFPVAMAFTATQGPLLIIKKDALEKASEKELTLAVPGLTTTSSVMVKRLYPDAELKVFPFDQIAAAVKEGQADGGVIVHENRIEDPNYERFDLGKLWYEKTQSYCPLGCLAVKKSLNRTLIDNLYREIRQSLSYGSEWFEKGNVDDKKAFILKHAQGDWNQSLRHIQAYVTEDSYQWSPEAQRGVKLFLEEAYTLAGKNASIDLSQIFYRPTQ
jgi:1,4-dihydroxy-6-naphthoate synthase